MSSGAESSNHIRRPRRAVPIKDYTWPTRSALLGDRAFDDVDDGMVEPKDVTPVHSDSPEEPVPIPDKAIAAVFVLEALVEFEPASSVVELGVLSLLVLDMLPV